MDVTDELLLGIDSRVEPGGELLSGFLIRHEVLAVKKMGAVFGRCGDVAVDRKVEHHGEFVFELRALNEGQAELGLLGLFPLFLRTS